MMKLVLASKNKKKLVEMNAILSQLGIEVCSEAEAGVDIVIDTETEGFDIVDGKLQPQEGAKTHSASYTITLSLAE